METQTVKVSHNLSKKMMMVNKMKTHTTPVSLEIDTDMHRKLFKRESVTVKLSSQVVKQLYIHGQKIKQKYGLVKGDEIELAICDLTYKTKVS